MLQPDIFIREYCLLTLFSLRVVDINFDDHVGDWEHMMVSNTLDINDICVEKVLVAKY